MPAAAAEKRTMARGTLFWPDVIEEISLVADDAMRKILWDGASFSCLSANGFPASVTENGSDKEYLPRATKSFLDFVREHFEFVDEDEIGEV